MALDEATGQMGQSMQPGHVSPYNGEAREHSEGMMARSIERQTAKLPSDIFLWGAVASMAVSLALRAASKDQGSTFVGQWVAPLLLFGVYNKIVKVAGSDRMEARR